jgi:hypothetical protein
MKNYLLYIFFSLILGGLIYNTVSAQRPPVREGARTDDAILNLEVSTATFAGEIFSTPIRIPSITDGDANPTVKLPVIECVATAAAPTYTEGSIVPCSTDLGGGLRTITAAGGTITSDQGAPNTTANRWPVQLTDGTDLSLITAAGELNVIATAQPGVDIGDVTITNATLAVTQSGQWDITDITGTVSLPTGAATSALQLADGHNVTVDNAAGGSAVNIQDGGNVITIDGNLTNISGTISLPTGASTSALQLADGHNVTVDNTVASPANTRISDGTDQVLVTGSGELQTIANAGTNLNTSALLLTTDFTTVLGTASLITSAVLGEGVTTGQDVLNVRNFNYIFNGSGFDFMREGGEAGSILVDMGANNDITGTVTANAGTDLNTSLLLLTTDFSGVLGTTELTTSTVLGDGASTALDVLNVRNFNYVFNGTTFDFVREGATAGSILVDGSNETQPISAASLPLPSGASTLAAQLADGHNVTVDNTVGAPANVQISDSTETALVTTGQGLHSNLRNDSGDEVGITARPLTVRLGDGTDLSLVTAAGELETIANAGSNLNTSLLQTTSSFSDVFGTTLLVTTAAIADAVADTQDVLNVRNFNYVFNGTSFDLVREGNTAGSILVDGSNETQPISAASLPLPSGASTSALQLAAGHDVTIDNAGAGAAVNIQDGGNIITVDGTVTANAGTDLNTSLLLTGTVHDAAFGTAGTADAQVRTVQGVASMTPLLVDLGSNDDINITRVSGETVVVAACENEEVTYTNINQTTGTQLLTGTSSERLYVCSIHLVVDAAQDVALVAGTGTVCATSTVAVSGMGGPAAATGWNFAINSGIVLANTGKAWGKTTVDADNVCLFQSGSAQISGGITTVSRANI